MNNCSSFSKYAQFLSGAKSDDKRNHMVMDVMGQKPGAKKTWCPK